MENLAKNLWIFNGKSVTFLGLPFSTRMTIIKLSNNELWVHSPIELTEALQQQVDSLGKVTFLIAPNHLDHLFVPQWIDAYSDAKVYGTQELIKKRNDISFNASLNNETSYPWSHDIAQILFTGSALMEECVFFHKQSNTLIVTDLVENFSGNDFNFWQKWLAKGAGILAPKGKTPIDWRLSFMFNKTQASKHIRKIFAWEADMLIMAHGEIIKKDATDFLRQSFNWLVKNK